jgi:hypothetical protein
MLRLIYSSLLRLYPLRFRKRFADEMMSIFDHAERKEAAWSLVADAFVSLVRQWTMRWRYWDEKPVPTVLAGTHGVPTFVTLESYRPRNVALVTGVAVTWFACATLFFGLTHSKVHAIYMPHVSFEKTSDWQPPDPTRRPAPSTAPRVASPTKSSALSNSNSSRTPDQPSVKKVPEEGTPPQTPQDISQRPELRGQSEQLGISTAAGGLLRSVVFKHHGFGDTLNATIIDEEQQYVNNRSRLRAETAYDQKIADDMKKELEDFWKRRGITVEVTTNLTQVPTAPRYVVLEVHIYRK